MAEAVLEHVNLAVPDPERSAAFFASVFGWDVRWRGVDQKGRTAVHVGGSTSYLSLYGPCPGESGITSEYGRPLHHIAVVVDDLETVEQRLSYAGIKAFGHGAYEPGHRFYFYDPDGIEFEVVSYRAQAGMDADQEHQAACQ